MKLTRKKMMNTFIEIGICSRESTKARAAIEGAFAIFRRYEKRYNFFDAESTLSRLNRRRSGRISKEMHRMLSTCFTISRESGGAFDITVGPLIRLWDFGAISPHIPPDQSIRDLLPLVDYRRIELENERVRLPDGVNLDLSGVVKGFAVDEACDYLGRKNIQNAMVNGGRNIRVMGKNKEGKPWRIGIADPVDQDDLVGVLTLEDEAVATSGDYENFFLIEGKRYHHLLNPATGYPVSSCRSVTVVSPLAGLGDILSTAAFVLGPAKGKELLARMGCHGVFITSRGIETTGELGGKFRLCDNRLAGTAQRQEQTE